MHENEICHYGVIGMKWVSNVSAGDLSPEAVEAGRNYVNLLKKG